MNKKELLRRGVPHDCVSIAVECLRSAAGGSKLKQRIQQILSAPQLYVGDADFGRFAVALIESRATAIPTPETSVTYQTWGHDLDDLSHKQVQNACRLPITRAAALMPDAHCGYGLPIGGVVACENAVIPYGVGVDIACRMKLTLTDLPVDCVERNDPGECRELDRSLKEGTVFGMGGKWQQPQSHPVMDEDWKITSVTRDNRDKAWRQLGTSGSGNHFVEWGVVTLPVGLGNLSAGRYVALLSHSGSRGAGAAVCNHYSAVARSKVPAAYRKDPELRHLAWLSMTDEDGQAYWAAMNLMGQYASANHEVIHRNVTRLAGAERLETVENHHNFAWRENHSGQTWYVHRKGATPAATGELGVIPGNMADSCFIVRGKGNPLSLNSAAHGAGRAMSRTAARRKFSWQQWNEFLRQRNTRLLAGGLDEVPGAYKNIHQVMAAQGDLVDVIGEFTPRIVLMCGDNSRAED